MTLDVRSRWIVPGLFWTFLAGIALGWWLRGGAPQPSLGTARIETESSGSTMSLTDAAATESPYVALPRHARTAEPSISSQPPPPPPVFASTKTTVIGPDPIAELRRRRLLLPLAAARVEAMKGSFGEGRDRGLRPHEAVDLMAPRNAPIHAVDNGVIAKLLSSRAGGLSVYQFDASGDYCYYYAHLEKYAAGLKEGMSIRAGDLLGYVGSSGNASPGAPHLHFAIMRLSDAHQWWKGTPVDPYRVYAEREQR